MTQGAELRFTRKAGPNSPVDSTQPSEPGIITMPDGSERRITLEIKVDGAWKKVDPKRIPTEYYKEIAERCHKIYKTTTQNNDMPDTLSVYFDQKNLPESWKSRIFGTFSSSFKDEVVDLTFKKIEYKTADSDKLKVWDIEKNDFSAQKDAIKVNKLTREMTPVSKAIFANREHFLEQPTKIKTKSAAERDREKLAQVKRSLNVQEVGSKDNRSLTLSIAAIVLKKLNGNLVEAARILKMTFVEGVDPLITLSNNFIERAAVNIESSRFYNQTKCFDSVVAALKSAGQIIADETDRETVARQYAALLRGPGQISIEPVLKAIEIDDLPIIMLKPSQGDLVVESVNSKIRFDDGLETCDLSNICFLVHDGLHYQPVIYDASNEVQQEKLGAILRTDMEKTLNQIQSLISGTHTPEAADQFEKLVTSVVNRYPFDAKPRIVEMLRIQQDLLLENNEVFIQGALTAFLSNNPNPVRNVERDVNPMIREIDDLISGPETVDDKWESLLNLIRSHVVKNRAARTIIVQTLKKRGYNVEDGGTTPPYEFAHEAARLFLEPNPYGGKVVL